MRKISLLIALIAITAMACSKKNTVDPVVNTDASGKIFRIAVQSDSKFYVTLNELHADKTLTDTLTLSYNSNSQLSYGYTPSVGSQITVKVLAPNGKALDCSFFYKGVKVGPDAVDTTVDGLEADFTYTVEN